jgi:hypothetical protein
MSLSPTAAARLTVALVVDDEPKFPDLARR